MGGRSLPLLLLLAVFTVAIRLDAPNGTTEAAGNASVSLEGRPNVQGPEMKLSEDIVYGIIGAGCWRDFETQMANITEVHWCEWMVIRRPYRDLQKCLEEWAVRLNYGYPNTLAHNYITYSHRLYFRNCSLQNALQDPPENVLLPLIITPICLIPFLVTLVVLKSKDGEMQS
ncbi:receptor activity-modifying protein 2 [Zootoca vivipara]|uniref:receptor activity-modifying protein 2 n=1 Tax=Zootoca vivipara TaxID=8524 RepID=UPI00293B9DEF|nr:receptor activity-modifying protein 2 [Zootoca vivipara]